MIAEFQPLICLTISEIINSLCDTDSTIQDHWACTYTLPNLSDHGKTATFSGLIFTHKNHG